ncbi:hypothetical protein [Chryseobacterium sp. 2987]|uniref:hypothetical protein n=1 Tax=Chryseobacterium sp. 2987 TaxID=2817767 RepID=UPI0028571657|nr:hypothetical protein [Chryseobacterium sp. 2987]MDR6921978.1 hypothetical protein [Chryseobacterium sp. 2987]
MEQQIVELIPVVEISISNEETELPETGPYWEYQKEWENYNNTCNQIAGFSGALKAYLLGSSLYEPHSISHQDLLNLLKVEMEKQDDEEKSPEELTRSFYGGYILKINGRDILFPQCCSDLTDITEWEDLIDDQENTYFYCGHPSPKVTQIDDDILFDFVNSEIQESFCPPVPLDEVRISRTALKTAVEKAKNELKDFAGRLEKVNRENNLDIKNIAEILVYGEFQD